MMFQTYTHGKCIITGEHAVLRGHPALVYPVQSRQLSLRFSASNSPLEAEFNGEFANNAQLLFWSVLEQGLSMTGRHLNDVNGRFTVTNAIPVGCGMGASAALCGALSQWFSWNHWIESDREFDFARELENLFHGKSSGVDIAASMADSPIVYQLNCPINPVKATWSPQLYLSYSGQIGVTSQCVEKVMSLWTQQPDHAARIDLQMRDATQRAAEALQSEQADRGAQLSRAINEARICFTQWGLTPETVEQKINALLAHGACAAKPTGSGNGGYILSLWQSKPDPAIAAELLLVSGAG